VTLDTYSIPGALDPIARVQKEPVLNSDLRLNLISKSCFHDTSNVCLLSLILVTESSDVFPLDLGVYTSTLFLELHTLSLPRTHVKIDLSHWTEKLHINHQISCRLLNIASGRTFC